MAKLTGGKLFVIFLLSVICVLTTYDVLYHFESIVLWEKIVFSVVLLLPYYVLYWFANNATLRRSKISAFILVVIALSFFLYAGIGIQIPKITYPTSTKQDIISYNGVPIDFVATMNFSTIGSFSAGNIVHVQIAVIDANVSNFLDYIGEVSFTGCSFPTPVFANNGVPLNEGFTLTQIGNNTYFAEGETIWYQARDTHLMWF